MLNVLGFSYDVSRPQAPTVGITVDGRDSLDDGDHPMGHSPQSLLDSGALLPREEPHRVALYGCGCGEFGCSTLTAVIVRDDPVVRWTDILEVGGAVFDSVLPYGDLADPVRRTPARHRGPELVFDAATYLHTVRSAMADRSWETRALRVAGLTRRRLGWTEDEGQVLAWPGEDDAMAVNVRLDGSWATYLVPIPGGPAEDAAAELARALAVRDPRRLPGARRLDL